MTRRTFPDSHLFMTKRTAPDARKSYSQDERCSGVILLSCLQDDRRECVLIHSFRALLRLKGEAAPRLVMYSVLAIWTADEIAGIELDSILVREDLQCDS